MSQTDPPKAPSRALNPKRERFCQEYLIDHNGTLAAQRAGYCPTNDAAAGATASRLLKDVKVAERIAHLEAKQVKRLEFDSDTILRELLRIATVDVTQAFDDMGGLKPFKEMPEDVRKSLAGLEVSELFEGRGEEKTAIGLLKKVKFWDKTRALEMLGKHLKLFADRIEHSGPDGKPIETKDVSALPDDQLDARIAAMLAKGKPAP